MDVNEVLRIIAENESQLDLQRAVFIPTRYPYTYAYDYVRAYHQAFRVYGANGHMPSRFEVAVALRNMTGDHREEALNLLANAYLYEHKIERECPDCLFDYILDPEEGCDTCAHRKVKSN